MPGIDGACAVKVQRGGRQLAAVPRSTVLVEVIRGHSLAPTRVPLFLSGWASDEQREEEVNAPRAKGRVGNSLHGKAASLGSKGLR